MDELWQMMENETYTNFRIATDNAHEMLHARFVWGNIVSRQWFMFIVIHKLPLTIYEFLSVHYKGDYEILNQWKFI